MAGIILFYAHRLKAVDVLWCSRTRNGSPFEITASGLNEVEDDVGGKNMTTANLPDQTKSRKHLAPSRFLTNISVGWKMGLMVFVLFLGILGIAVSAYVGLQSMQYQLSNIYDFMLVPIVAINHADTSLSDAQDFILQSSATNISAEARTQKLEDIAASNQIAQDTITRYDTEWVTTSSLEFTQALRSAGKISLQENELAALAAYHDAYDKYQQSLEQYLASVQKGQPDAALASDTIANLRGARTYLQELIAINNQFADFSNTEAQGAYRQALITSVVVVLIAAAIGLFLSFLITASITNRLGNLTQSAEAMQKGNLDQSVLALGRDEVGLLGTAFNNMARQLKDLIATLEQRVADRTKALGTVAEISTAVSTILETDKLLQEVVDFSKERFNFYHAHIYLLNDAGDKLVLASGAGDVGRKMVAEGRIIPLDREQSLVARAARERKGVTVNDVTQAPDFLPNPLLPNTRSELAVPMVAGEDLIGVFDVQSDLIGRFTEADISIQTTLASQIATAVQNARLYTEAEISQSRMQAVLDAATQISVIATDPHGLITVFNAGAERMLGYSSDEVVGINSPAIMHLESEVVARGRELTAEFGRPIQGFDVLVEYARQGRFEEREWTYLQKDGTHIKVLLIVTALRDKVGEITGFLGMAQDITERKRLGEITTKRAWQQEALNLITQQIQSATTVEAALQIAARELGHALGMKPTLVTLDPSALADERGIGRIANPTFPANLSGEGKGN
jgi:PAS domain S-box-containing protein